MAYEKHSQREPVRMPSTVLVQHIPVNNADHHLSILLAQQQKEATACTLQSGNMLPTDATPEAYALRNTGKCCPQMQHPRHMHSAVREHAARRCNTRGICRRA
ncbi:TPA: hypothetical protein ACH3X3_001203 [Trebouxia sp. C0006]